MTLYAEENQLVSKIRTCFPAESAITDRWLSERGWDVMEAAEIPYIWIEAFADRAGDAARLEDIRGLKAQTGFLAEQYRIGSKAIHAIIDVAYAENILWNADDNVKLWAWPYIATEIRQLNEAFWGTPRF